MDVRQLLLRHFRSPANANLSHIALSVHLLTLVFELPSALLMQSEFLRQSLVWVFEEPLLQVEVASQLSAA